jgi:aminoglycoside phosphotransferase (APT) family kinase protein
VPSRLEVEERPAPELVDAVAALLPGAGPFRWQALSGGVSSDIWRIEGPGGTFCVKRALPRLKVAADWFAPVRRNCEEVKWLRFAATATPAQVPAVIAADSDRGIAVLSWFDPAHWENWKTLLLSGRVRTGLGADAGRLLATLHATSARQAEVDPTFPAHFDNLDLLESLRLEPYFGEAARHNPEVAEVLASVRTTLRTHRTALIHGDVSPKNFLVHPGHPLVLLDAECACWGDPAFDYAFLASHLLLKAAHLPNYGHWYFETLRKFMQTYAEIAREPVDERAALLIPALMLARIDGKSPVEYLDAKARRRVRNTVLAALEKPHSSGMALLAAYREEYFL